MDQTHGLDLPEELLLEIFKYLDYKSIASVRGASSTMFRIGTDWTLMENFTLGESQKKVQRNKTETIAERLPDIGLTMIENYLKIRPLTGDNHLISNWLFNQRYMHSARIRFYCTKVLRLLLKYNHDLNDPDAIKQALRIKDDGTILGMLLAEGFNPNEVDNILGVFTRGSDYHAPYLRILLAAGLNPNKKNEKHHPLNLILQEGDIDRPYNRTILKLLLFYGADPNARNHRERIGRYEDYPITAFFRNAQRWIRPLNIFKHLIKAGADPKKPQGDNNPLLIICTKGIAMWDSVIPVIKILTRQCGLNMATVAQYNPNNNRFVRSTLLVSPPRKSHLDRATVDKNRCDVAKLLLKCKVDVNARQSIFGELPLHWAVKHRRNNLVKILLHYDADPNKIDRTGSTPLHYIKTKRKHDVHGDFALTNRNNAKEIVSALLQVGANPEIKNRIGETAKELIMRFLKLDCMYRKLI